MRREKTDPLPPLAFAVYLLSFALPAVIDTNLHGDGAYWLGYQVFAIALLTLTDAPELFVAFAANPLFMLAFVCLIADKLRAAAIVSGLSCLCGISAIPIVYYHKMCPTVGCYVWILSNVLLFSAVLRMLQKAKR